MTIGPWDRETVQRGTEDRGRGRVDFVTVRGVPYKLLVNVLPRQTVVLDEMSITPSRRYRDQDTVRQAKQVLAQSKSGKPVAPGNIEILQQRLLTMEKQAQLVGRTSEGERLAEDLGEVRRSNLVNQALDTLARAKKGRLPERSIESLQKKLMSMEHQDEVAGRRGEGRQLSEALGEVRRSQLVGEATDMLVRARRGPRLDPRTVDTLQQRLLEMERQDELFGRESEGRQLAEALGEVRRSQLVTEARAVLARAKQGRGISNDHIKKLQQLLGAMERQDEMRGRESVGLQLAVELSQLRR